VKIAQIAPLAESVPPRTYGGTERIVSYLTEELVKLGHEVTLFASGDSITSANLVKLYHRMARSSEAVASIAQDDFVPFLDPEKPRNTASCGERLLASEERR
jgi:hypothetical protein